MKSNVKSFYELIHLRDDFLNEDTILFDNKFNYTQKSTTLKHLQCKK